MRIINIICLIGLISIKTISAQTINENYVDGIIYFKTLDELDISIPFYSNKDELSNSLQAFPEFEALLEKYGVIEIIKPFKTRCNKVQRTYRMTFDKAEMIDELLKDLSLLYYIDYAEKSPIYRILNIPNDLLIGSQYYLENINAFAAWEIAQPNYKTKVAIVDDAVKITHPDLEANVWINPGEVLDGEDTDGNGFIDDIHGWDVSDNDNNPGPPANPPFLWGELAFTHGTHCAGLAGAVTNNDFGIAGVSNNNISIIGVKAVSNSSWFPLAISNAVEGVDYAVAAGADVISMSFGGAASAFTTLQNIITAGDEMGIIFVAAAGNDGNENPTYPAAWENVIAVGATNIDDNVASFSQRGSFIDLMAPGEGMFSSLAWSEEFGNQDGTSMACPLVAGAIALLKSHNPMASKQEIIDCLLEGCDNIDELNPSLIGKMGAGRLNVYNSLQCLGEPVFSEIAKNVKINVYPNPASELIFIKFESDNTKRISITDLSGKIQMVLDSDLDVIDISISQLCKGMYFITVVDGNKTLTSKFIKE